MISTEAEPKLREECGVVGVFTPNEPAAALAHAAAYSLRHRGRNAWGMTGLTTDGLVTYKEVGSVPELYPPEAPAAILNSSLVLAHDRWGTYASVSEIAAAQPHNIEFGKVVYAAQVVNGHLANAASMQAKYESQIPSFETDCHLLAQLIAVEMHQSGADLPAALAETLPKVQGAYSWVGFDLGMVPRGLHQASKVSPKLYGLRDPHGIRPLVIGELPNGGIAFASETIALDAMGASYLRSVKPGELVSFDGNELNSVNCIPTQPL